MHNLLFKLFFNKQFIIIQYKSSFVILFLFRSDAMKKIQKLLRKKEFEEAVGLLRASRYEFFTQVISFIFFFFLL